MSERLSGLGALRVESKRPVWQGLLMKRRATKAGGCFLTLCILGGFVIGLATAEPMKGVLIGTAIGATLAVLLWLIDRA